MTPINQPQSAESRFVHSAPILIGRYCDLIFSQRVIANDEVSDAIAGHALESPGGTDSGRAP